MLVILWQSRTTNTWTLASQSPSEEDEAGMSSVRRRLKVAADGNSSGRDTLAQYSLFEGEQVCREILTYTTLAVAYLNVRTLQVPLFLST